MKTYAVIVAGGSGSRMGSELPKQFLPLHGEPVLIHTIRAFLKAVDHIQVIVVLPALHLESGRTYLHQFLPGLQAILVNGGPTRFDSVRNGLAFTDDESIVFVHDAVRCMISPALIRQCFQDALQYGSSIPVVAVKDSIRRIEGEQSVVVDRSVLRAVQTPQTFPAGELKKAFEQPNQPAFTDEATVWESYGKTVHLTEGEERNIKITYPTDLLIAEQLIKKG